MANQCPKCGNKATGFSDFLLSFRAMQCRHCNTKLEIDYKAVLLLLFMVILGLAVPVILVSINMGYDVFSWGWVNIAVVAGYTAIWYVVTSLLAWLVLDFNQLKIDREF